MKLAQLAGAILLLSFFFFFGEAEAQEYFYFSSGPKQLGRVTSANDEKVGVLLDGVKPWNAGRDKILIAFNQRGSYLVIADISTDPNQAQSQIEAFYKETTDPKNLNDILFKSVPFEIIACTIKSDLEEVVNYSTLEGKSATINKDNLLAIIKRDGSHQLLGDVAEVVPNLQTSVVKFRQMRGVKKAPVETPKPAPKPQVAVAPAPVEVEPAPADKKKLTAEAQKIYKAKSVVRVEEFAKYLNEIVDKKRSRSEKDEAIKKAVKMFVPGATMEVSAINNTGKTVKRKIEDYLDRLSRLSYPKISITYAELKVIDDFEPDGLGNFWGIVSGEQTFTGGVSDVTRKNYKVKLKPYQKSVEGTNEQKFEILLGNVEVQVSQ